MVSALRDVKSLLTVRAVADMLGLKKPDAVLRAIASGSLPASNISNGSGRATWRISADDLQAFIESRRAVPTVATPKRTARRKAATVTKYF
jgi:excisionase family DNA binding protein